MVYLNYIYLKYINPMVFLGTLGVLLVALAHYIFIGPNMKRLGKLEPEIERLSIVELATHCMRMTSFIMLAITGIGFALFKVTNWGFSYEFFYHIHLFFAVFFTISTIVSILIWFKDSLFKSYDWEWFKVLGGYLTKKEVHPPSGKFNAGQKVFYWFSSLLSIFIIISGYYLTFPNKFSISQLLGASIVHGVAAIILIAGVIVHAYLGTFANPGTFGAIIHGRVAKEWAELHHPYWKK